MAVRNPLDSMDARPLWHADGYTWTDPRQRKPPTGAALVDAGIDQAAAYAQRLGGAGLERDVAKQRAGASESGSLDSGARGGL
jgi:hypothetical protein